MSMIFEMVGVTPEQIARLQVSPSLANDVLVVAGYDNNERRRQELLEAMPSEKRARAEARYQTRASDPYFLEGRREVAQARDHLTSFGPIEAGLDLQKSWHILHYVLTGDIGPVGSPGDALLTGEDVGEATTGYGPPRLQTPEATREFSTFLSAQTLEQMQARANFQQMTQAGIYSMPMGPGSEADFESDVRRAIASYFPLLRNYVCDVAAKGNGLLMWIT